jgi:hypothetical protein
MSILFASTKGLGYGADLNEGDKMTASTPWIDDTVARLKKWWENGMSAEEISHKFKQEGRNITRNSVIGKAHRLKILYNSAKSKKAKAPVKERAKLAFVPGIVPHPAPKRRQPLQRNRGKVMKEIKAPVVSSRVSLIEARDGQCRAIVGYEDNLLAKAICCGSETIPSSSWCDFHRSIYTIEGSSR